METCACQKDTDSRSFEEQNINSRDAAGRNKIEMVCTVRQVTYRRSVGRYTLSRLPTQVLPITWLDPRRCAKLGGGCLTLWLASLHLLVWVSWCSYRYWLRRLVTSRHSNIAPPTFKLEVQLARISENTCARFLQKMHFNLNQTYQHDFWCTGDV